jgi:hypothetical protein
MIYFYAIDIQVGDCGYFCVENRHVFYLVTKENYFHKQTLKTLEASLISCEIYVSNNL